MLHDILKKVPLILDNWLKVTQVLISAEAESKHSVSSGFSLGVWTDGPRVTRGALGEAYSQDKYAWPFPFSP